MLARAATATAPATTVTKSEIPSKATSIWDQTKAMSRKEWDVAKKNWKMEKVKWRDGTRQSKAEKLKAPTRLAGRFFQPPRCPNCGGQMRLVPIVNVGSDQVCAA
jgi:hypothetical protein